VVLSVAAPAPLILAPPAERVDGSYIVVMKAHVTSDHLRNHVHTVFNIKDSSTLFDIYDMEGFKGYSGKLSASKLASVRLSADVDFIEEDKIMRVAQSCASQSNAEWGLDRISERQIDLDGTFHYNSGAGSGVDAYIIDTGILITHT